MNTKAVLSPQQKDSNYCPHMKAALDAKSEKRYAAIEFVNVEALLKKLADEEIEKTLNEHGVDGEIWVYTLPGGNQVVPNFYEEDEYVHIR